ncbi:MAG: hypothetical protein QM765_25970 [Myxococcales bacterium]
MKNLVFVALSALLLAGCASEIQHNLSESEANDIVVLLERNHITAHKEKEEGGREVTWKIAVPKAHMANAMFLLKENELPGPRTRAWRSSTAAASSPPPPRSARCSCRRSPGSWPARSPPSTASSTRACT